MREKIKKINLKTFSVIGIILSVSALILSAIVPNSGNEKLNNFDSWAVITVFLAVIYLLVFSILNLFKPRKTLSILGIILSLLAVILGSIVVIKSPPIKLIDKLEDFLFIFSALFLGIISIVSLFKSIYKPAEIQKSESEIEKIISKKVGRKTVRDFLIIFSLLIILLLVSHFVISPFFMDNEWLEPYLHKGDYFLVEKFNKSIRKGDIVMTRTRNDLIVSLVIGLPGDKIELKDGTFFVNGEPLKKVSYYLYHAYGMDYNTGNYFIVVPSDSFFGMSTLLDETFADSEQKTNGNLSTDEQTTQEHQNISNSLCPYENSYLNPKDNLCYCKEGYVFNKERTKCITYNEACSLLYGPHSIAGEGDAQNKFLCYCKDGFIWNKKEGEDKKCVKGVDLSWWLYKQSDIIGKVIYHYHTTNYKNP
jgi:signal peptidase I